MAYEDKKCINVALDAGVLRLTLNNPEKRNAIDVYTSIDLEELITRAAFDPDVQVIVLTGAGSIFSAGGDIPDMLRKIDDPNIFYEGIFHSRRLVFSILDCRKPIICRINGDCIGLGASVALLCDIVVANNDAKIADPHVNVGLVAGDGGAVIWPMLVGYARAKRHLLTGDPITGKEAAEIGLVAGAGTPAEVDEMVERYIKKLSRGAATSIHMTKMTINVLLRQQAQALMDVGMAYEGLSNISADHREAVMAFKEKRKPNFIGK